MNYSLSRADTTTWLVRSWAVWCRVCLASRVTFTNECVMSHTWMSHVTHANELCRICCPRSPCEGRLAVVSSSRLNLHCNHQCPWDPRASAASHKRHSNGFRRRKAAAQPVRRKMCAGNQNCHSWYHSVDGARQLAYPQQVLHGWHRRAIHALARWSDTAVQCTPSSTLWSGDRPSS